MVVSFTTNTKQCLNALQAHHNDTGRILHFQRVIFFAGHGQLLSSYLSVIFSPFDNQLIILTPFFCIVYIFIVFSITYYGDFLYLFFYFGVSPLSVKILKILCFLIIYAYYITENPIGKYNYYIFSKV